MLPADPAVAALPRPRDTGIIGFYAMGALLLALTIVYPSATRIHTWPWAGLAALYWFGAVALLIVSLARGETVAGPNALVRAGLLILVTAAILSAVMSPFVAASLPRIWPTLGGAAVFFGLYQWLRHDDKTADRTTRLANGICQFAGAITLFSLFGWCGGEWPLPWGTRNTIPFGHSIYTGGFMVLALPWFVWSSWRNRGARRAGWSAMIAVALVVLASTSSRGAALAFGVAATAAAFAIVSRVRWPIGQKIGIIVAVVVVAVTAVLANPRLRALAFDRSWNDASRESNRQRSAMLAAGFKLGRERPWLGWGPGTVPLAYPQVRAQVDGGVDNVLQLHNTPLQIWATLGIAGLAGVALLVAGTIHVAALRFRNRDGVVESLAAITSLGGYGLFALTDHQFDMPVITTIAAANLALLTSSAEPVSRRVFTRTNRAVRLVGLSSGLVLLIIPLLRDLRARRVYNSAIAAWDEGRAADWIAGLDRARAVAPHDPYYDHQAAAALLRARDAETDPTKRGTLARTAMERLENSLRTGVHLEFAHFNLGWLNLDLDRPQAAARHFTAAAHLVPDKGGVYFGLGLALHAAGARAAAIRAFALEWVSDPRSMSSPAWEIPALAPLRTDVRAEALRWYAELRGQTPLAATADAWAQWWLGEPADRSALSRGFSAEARQFAGALASIETGAAIHGDEPWAKIYRAWREPAVLSGFTNAAGGDMALAAALQRRAQRHRESFRSFLAAPTEDEPSLLRSQRRLRTGYGVLALHPDGPIVGDVYIVQENRVVSDFTAPLLPPKGWLPGRLVLALLQRVTVANDTALMEPTDQIHALPRREPAAGDGPSSRAQPP